MIRLQSRYWPLIYGSRAQERAPLSGGVQEEFYLVAARRESAPISSELGFLAYVERWTPQDPPTHNLGKIDTSAKLVTGHLMPVNTSICAFGFDFAFRMLEHVSTP